MHASVYRLRAAGAPLPRPSEPVQGNLLLCREQRGDVDMLVARLMGGPAHEVLPALLRAEVRLVTEHGMVIRGVEPLSRGQQKSRVRYTPQTWWAFILTEAAVDRFEGFDPLDTLADEARGRRSMGRDSS
jgi:hypothetical protein